MSWRRGNAVRVAPVALAYSNLYYACQYCNGYKHACWPGTIELEMGFRFVDPCAEDPYNHFRFDGDGRVWAKTNAARYTIAHLRLNRPQLVGLRERLATRVSRLLTLLRFFGERLAIIQYLEQTKNGALAEADLAEKVDVTAARAEVIALLGELVFPKPSNSTPGQVV